MNRLSNKHINCPYCGESIELVIDCSVPEQDYIEDCEVCCRPINLSVCVDQKGVPAVYPRHENE